MGRFTVRRFYFKLPVQHIGDCLMRLSAVVTSWLTVASYSPYTVALH